MNRFLVFWRFAPNDSQSRLMKSQSFLTFWMAPALRQAALRIWRRVSSARPCGWASPACRAPAKTVFITALVHALLKGGRFPAFEALAQGRITRCYLEPHPTTACRASLTKSM